MIGKLIIALRRLVAGLAPATSSPVRSSALATFTGKLFDPMQPDPNLFELQDIAHALANLCRYNGQTARFYSVAEHSLLVCLVVGFRAEAMGLPADEVLRLRRWALVHDATEAYLGDVPSPIKRLPALQPYRDAEAHLARLLASWFGLEGDEPSLVTSVDKEICGTEKHWLFTKHDGFAWKTEAVIPGLVCGVLDPEEAEARWLAKYEELFHPERAS